MLWLCRPGRSKKAKRLMTDCALNFCKRFFTGDVVTGCIGSACPRHGVVNLLDCLRRDFTDLPLSSRHGLWRRLNMPASYGGLFLRAWTGRPLWHLGKC